MLRYGPCSIRVEGYGRCLLLDCQEGDFLQEGAQVHEARRLVTFCHEKETWRAWRSAQTVRAISADGYLTPGWRMRVSGATLREVAC